ncbi:MAG: fibronectin type III domain-containing protein, partial [Bacteroidia bacterium]|nr:fibronectin type III domain-containing protein [Bacteroidia bacterium]MDW8157663.1 fibronectin type III domain-containing protein [Bacteroidia bacterium]
EQNPLIYNVSSVQSGGYSVVAVIGNCTSNVAVAAGTINPIPNLLSVGSNSPVCSRRTLELTAIGTPEANYLWVGPNGYAATGRNVQRVNLSLNDEGIYSAVAILQGCTSQPKSLRVEVRPTPPTPTLGTNAPICAGEELQLTAPRNAGAIYSWLGPDGFTSSLASVTITNATPSHGGLYSLVWSVNGCVSDTAVVHVVVNQPSVRISTTRDAICPGDTANLLFGLAGNGPWAVELLKNGLPETILMDQTPFVWSVNPLVSTTYVLRRVTDANGCIAQASGSVMVKVGSLPDAILLSSVNPIVCGGSNASLQLEVRGASQNWSLVYAAGNTIETVHGRGNGVFSITTPAIRSNTRIRLISISNADESPSCIRSLSGDATEVVYNIYPPVDASVSADTMVLCEGKPWVLPLTLQGVGPWRLRYTYANEEQEVILGENRQVGPLNVDLPIAKTAQGRLVLNKIEDTHGCIADINKSIITILRSAPSASFERRALQVCPGQAVELSIRMRGSGRWIIDYTENGVAQNWSINNDQLIDGVFKTSITPSNSRLYVLRSVRDNAGCVRELNDSLRIETLREFALPLLASNTGPVCDNRTQQVQLQVSSLEGAEGYLWRGPNGFTSTQRNPVLPSPIVAGVYSVVAFAGNCTTPVSTTEVVVISANSLRILGNTTPCVGSTLTLSTNLNAGNVQYFWSGPQGYSSNNAIINIPNISAVQSGVYEVFAIVGNCTTNRAFANVAVSSGAIGEIVGNTTTICSITPNNVILNLRFSGLPPFGVKIRANGSVIAELSGITTTTLAYPVTANGNTLFDLIDVTDAGNCGAQSRGSLQVIVGSGPQLRIVEQNNADCNGASVRVEATGGSGNYVYSIDGVNFNNTSGIFRGLPSGVQQIFVRDAANCVSSILVNIQPQPGPRILALNMTETTATISWEAVPTAASYTIEYQEGNSSPRVVTGITSTTTTITGLQPNRAYSFRVIPVCASGASLQASEVEVGVTRIIGCSAPQQARVSSITQESAVISWITSSATCYILSWGLEGTDPSEWQQVLVPHPGNSFTISGLLPGRRYVARLRTNCTLCSFTIGDISSWSSPITFTTPANRVEYSNSMISSIRIYPNPTQSTSNLSFTASNYATATIYLVDVTGRLLLEKSILVQEGYNEIELDLSALPTGIYWIRLQQGETTQVVKLMKK